MRQAALAFAVVAVACLVASAPSMAADEGPNNPFTTMSGDGDGPVELVFADRSPEAPRHKPKPKRRVHFPGREAMSGLMSDCTHAGFLFETLGLVGIVRTCEDSDESNGLRPRFP